ncbi:MAG: glycosyltransferase [Solirubrobacterales bacterium]
MTEGSTARIAVVIPAYRQPQFLGAAIRSALGQRCSVGVQVVVVNDGCPYESTESIALELCQAHPLRTAYLRQPNRGLSAARNAGIRHALEAWPTVGAVFPLDADNRLSPDTLELLWAALQSSPEAAWVSPRFEFIGDRDDGWQIPGPFSAYRQLFDNQSDAGSLIDREVFERGIFYDETMRDGYEDWELFIRAVRAGLRGAPAGSCGFRYRTRAHSMVAGAKRRHEAAYGQILERHRDAFEPRRLTALEHDEMPRYALVRLDERAAELTTALDLPPRRASLAAFIAAVVRSRGGLLPIEHAVAPMTVIGSGAAFDWVRRHGLLAGVLYRLQGELRGRACVAARLGGGAGGGRIETVSGAEVQSSAAGLLALRTRALYERGLAGEPEAAAELAPEAVLEIELGAGASAADLPALEPWLATVQAEHRGARELPLVEIEGETHSTFAARRHLDELETTLPWAGAPGSPSLFVLLPGGGLGGMQRAALELAAAMRELDQRLSTHLVLTDGPAIDASITAGFDSVAPLGGTDPALASRLLGRLLGSADVVVNAHSALGYAVLPELEWRPAQVSMLATFELDSLGFPTGYPMQVAREYEPLIDVFFVCSQKLKRQLANLYVTPEKLVVGRNAPVVRPPSLAAGLEIARRKAARKASAAEPMRLLYAGRLDRQKGIERLAAVARALDSASQPVELTLAGEAVLGEEAAEFPATTRFLGTVDDLAELGSHYETADAFLLPSRWEGAPLALLDAMAFGCVVIATDVGAVPELVADGFTGHLVDHRLTDEEIAARMVAVILDLLRTPGASRGLRERACEEAIGLTWHDAARPLLAAVDPAARAELRD